MPFGPHYLQIIWVEKDVVYGLSHLSLWAATNYHNKLRLNKAKGLIVNEGVRSSVVISRVDYESAPQLRKEFKRYFVCHLNVPPTEVKMFRYASIA
jgi:AraC-like DNA-binding protein